MTQSLAQRSPVLYITPHIRALIDLALEEDLGRGDATTDATIPRELRATGQVLVKEALILCGLPVARHIFTAVSSENRFSSRYDDGASLVRGDVAAEVAGPAWALLAAERTALNFLQRLSGVATSAHNYAAAAKSGGAARVTDTRKTTPGFRALEKWAVLVGGAANHRADLGGGVLIKDNHVAIAGGVAAAVQAARKRASHALRIEVEVTTLDQIDEALSAGAEAILLDNMDDEAVAQAVEKIRRHPQHILIEVSGGITLERIPRLSSLGVDLISSGAITHSARAVDLSLELALQGS